MTGPLRQGRSGVGGTAGAERGRGVGTEGLGWEGRPTVTDRKERPEKHKRGQPRARTGTRSRAGGEQGEGRRREEEGKR